MDLLELYVALGCWLGIFNLYILLVFFNFVSFPKKSAK